MLYTARCSIFLATMLLFAMAFTTTLSARPWTSQKIEGSLTGINCKTKVVTLRMPSGNILNLPFSLLTDADKKHLIEHIKGLAVEQAQPMDVSPLLAELVNSIGMKFRLIPAGEFIMGSPETEKDRDNDETQHQIKISKPYYLGTCEVTQGQWKKVMGSSLRDIKDECWSFKGYGADYPMYWVSWYDAVRFCNKLSTLEKKKPYYRITRIKREEYGVKPGINTAKVVILGGNGYHLPTEAQWEYACRAGTTTPFSFGSKLNGKRANCDGDCPYGTETKGPNLGRTTTVGSYRANSFGLYDMHGNVWEWCTCGYNREYCTKPPQIDPRCFSSKSYRVRRGGSWYGLARYCRSANRRKGLPEERGSSIGFRIVLDCPTQENNAGCKSSTHSPTETQLGTAKIIGPSSPTTERVRHKRITKPTRSAP